MFGAFGKIPSVGDFFRINAPPGFAAIWDEWVQRCLVSGAHMYADGWDDLYMSVPIWRFSLSADIAGPNPIMGVFMPSVDRVGRRFPLTLMGPLPGDAPLVPAHLGSTQTFEALEEIALSVLDEDIGKDMLEDKLSSVDWQADMADARCRIVPGAVIACKATAPEMLTPQLSADLLARAFSKPSVWTALMKDDTRLMVCDGLPEGANMQGLFDLDAEIWREGIS